MIAENLLPRITSLELDNQRIFLRADLNVPLQNGIIAEEFRLQKILATLDYLLAKKCKITLATHLGRPTPAVRTQLMDASLSTRIIANWLNAHGYSIDHESDLLQAQEKSHQASGIITLLENLRFYTGEKEYNLTFAELLAGCADIYINDAFGLLHSNDTSVTLLAEQFAKNKKAAGLLMIDEIISLDKLKQDRQKPFVLIIGGSKITEKISFLEKLLTSNTVPITDILIGGAISYSFFTAKHNIELLSPHPFITSATLAGAKHCLMTAAEKKITVITPMDMIAREHDDTLSIVETTINPEKLLQLSLVDIGPKTIELYSKKLIEAKMIFSVGTMGKYEEKAASAGTKEIYQALAKSRAYRIIGGGDGVAAAHAFDIQNSVDFLSTGGSATLAFLGSNNPFEEFATLCALIQ